MRRARLIAVAVGAAILAGPWLAPPPHSGPATGGPPSSELADRSSAPVIPTPAQVAVPAEPTTVLAVDDPAALAVATSSALYATAPVVVLAAADDGAGQRTAATVAERVGAPLLLTPASGDPTGGDPATSSNPTGGDPTVGDPATGNNPTGNNPTVGDPATGNNPTGNNPTVGDPATGNNPTGNNPTGNNPTGNNPTGGDPTVGDPATGNNPTGNNPTGNNPTGNNPTGGDPTVGDPATGNNPTGNNPTGNNPTGGDPTVGDPATGNNPTGGYAATGGDPTGGDPAGVGTELARLGARTVLAVGDRAVHWADAAGGSADVVTEEGALPPAVPPAPRPDVLVLVPDQQRTLAAATTARASGARTIEIPGGDPRRDPTRIPADVAQADRSSTRLLALGTEFGNSELLDRRLAVAATGTQLPGGGQLAFPGRRIVALYGHPGAPALGVLGEQNLAASVARAGALAAEYGDIVDEPVVPAFEIITTVADTAPGPDGDYSAEASVEELQPWVDAAGAAGVYVMLDLQPGRTDFLAQARRYTPLLARPHVGLALDPEWRLRPDQRHGQQIGSVTVEEINAVAGWLAELTREHVLPQKLLMIHQFRTMMIIGRDRLDTSHDELAVLVHADGFGPPSDKIKTWNLLHQLAPGGIHWGWKNFYDEDRPMFTPAETMRIGPAAPVFVSYQ